MSGRLSGKVAFVTGVARGQGRAHAQRLAAEGAEVIAVDLCAPLPSAVPYDSATPDDLDETVRLVEAAGGKIFAAVADTRDLASMRTVVDEGVARFGRLDVIVANAGICIPEPWDTITPESFQAVIDTNVTGTWNTVMAGAQHIVDGGRGGSIILISSASGVAMQPFMIHYTSSKHAVTGMARAFAAELGKYSIRVNSVAPGPVATPMGSGDMVGALTRAAETDERLAGMNTPLLPEGIAMPEDIADAVCWLAGDESRFVTAASISVDLGSAQY